MDYTQSPQSVVHPGTGHRLHKQDQAIPTQVTDKDINHPIWSLMHVLATAEVAGAQFNPDDIATYDRLLVALRKLFVRADVGVWAKDFAGNDRTHFEAISGGNGATYLRGYGTHPIRLLREDGAEVAGVTSDGQAYALSDAVDPTSLPRLGQVLGLIANAGRNLQVFTSNGSFLVPPGVTQAEVICTGAGGGGGGDYGGGGAGGTAIKRITGLVPGATIAVTVGVGGAVWGNGGASSFGAYCTGLGGSTTPDGLRGGDGGGATGGDLNLKGGGGGYAANWDGVGAAGHGGNSVWGGAGYGGHRTGGGPGAANTGGGGGGAAAGGSGVVIVRW